MDRLLLERIQELSGVKKTIVAPDSLPLKEEFDSWHPQDEMLKELVNMHNRVFQFLNMYQNSDSVGMSTRRKAIEMVQYFYDNIEDEWEDYVPDGIDEITVTDEQGNANTYNPEVAIETCLEEAKKYLRMAERTFNWTETSTYLDFAYSFGHGVLKVIKAIQDKEGSNAGAIN